jgi:hypothetical protein
MKRRLLTRVAFPAAAPRQWFPQARSEQQKDKPSRLAMKRFSQLLLGIVNLITTSRRGSYLIALSNPRHGMLRLDQLRPGGGDHDNGAGPKSPESTNASSTKLPAKIETQTPPTGEPEPAANRLQQSYGRPLP